MEMVPDVAALPQIVRQQQEYRLSIPITVFGYNVDHIILLDE